MILFCLPYAGGSGSIYHRWRNYLDSSINLYPIELKGRGRRFNEPFYESFEDAIEDIFNVIKDKVCDDEYVIYGHSMGSLLAYELYYKICNMGFRKPKHMFFSGHKAPNLKRNKENIHTLSDCDFMKKIIELGGTPEEILNNNELLEIFTPILKNDFKILEKYHYTEKVNKIECNLSVFSGEQDSITLKELAEWNRHGSGESTIYIFEGNHFFINNNAENVTNIINRTLCEEKTY